MKGRTPGSRRRRGEPKRALLASPASPAKRSSPTNSLTAQLENVSLFPASPTPSSHMLLDAPPVAEEDFILSQDFFCTPDYITPDGQQICFESNKENVVCPKSPEKSINEKKRRNIQDVSPCNSLSIYLPCNKHVDFQIETYDSKFSNEPGEAMSVATVSHKRKNYVSQSAVALRCQAMPPPCIKNPYFRESTDLDIFKDRRPKYPAFSPPIGSEGLSRYCTDFHEIKQIGSGNFSRVFKVLKRIDGCMYAVKKIIKQMHNDMERMCALMEVQVLAALGPHENIVGYYTSWFENEQLYIQMELCDHCLSISNPSIPKGGEILEVLYQIAKALYSMHEHGIAHMDVKPENIYVRNGVYKLGDFGCATLTDRSLRIEEGDCRYMPQEILNEKYENLDKVDIFSLGASIYELIKGSPLPDSGPQFSNLREGKISLLPGHSVQFRNLLKVMMDPNPTKRPAAREVLENPIFARTRRS